MTELLLKVNHAAKTVTATGKVAAGEDVAITLDMGAPVEDMDQLRVRFRHLGTDVAVFPWLGEEWTEQTVGAEDGVYCGVMNTNTEELATIFADLPDRATHSFDVIVDQVPDEDGTDDSCVMYGIGKIRLQKWNADLTLTDVKEGRRPKALMAALDEKIGREELAEALAEIEDLTTKSTQRDIRMKVNQILSLLRGLITIAQVAVVLFVTGLAFAVPWENVPPNTPVNTEIVGSEIGAGLTLEDGVLSSDGVTGGTVTNIVNGIVVNATNSIPLGIEVDGTPARKVVSSGSIVWDFYDGSATPTVDPQGVIIDWANIADRPDIDALDIRTNLPPVSATATVGDLVDTLNAVIGALHKETQETP